MPIVFASEGKIIRKEVKNFLQNLSKKKELRILDIGASANPWLGELITDTIDFIYMKRNKINSHIGDANLITTYKKNSSLLLLKNSVNIFLLPCL